MLPFVFGGNVLNSQVANVESTNLFSAPNLSGKVVKLAENLQRQAFSAVKLSSNFEPDQNVLIEENCQSGQFLLSILDQNLWFTAIRASTKSVNLTVSAVFVNGNVLIDPLDGVFHVLSFDLFLQKYEKCAHVSLLHGDVFEICLTEELDVTENFKLVMDLDIIKIVSTDITTSDPTSLRIRAPPFPVLRRAPRVVPDGRNRGNGDCDEPVRTAAHPPERAVYRYGERRLQRRERSGVQRVFGGPAGRAAGGQRRRLLAGNRPQKGPGELVRLRAPRHGLRKALFLQEPREHSRAPGAPDAGAKPAAPELLRARGGPAGPAGERLAQRRDRAVLFERKRAAPEQEFSAPKHANSGQLRHDLRLHRARPAAGHGSRFVLFPPPELRESAIVGRARLFHAKSAGAAQGYRHAGDGPDAVPETVDMGRREREPAEPDVFGRFQHARGQEMLRNSPGESVPRNVQTAEIRARFHAAGAAGGGAAARRRPRRLQRLLRAQRRGGLPDHANPAARLPAGAAAELENRSDFRSRGRRFRAARRVLGHADPARIVLFGAAAAQFHGK